MLPIDSLDPDIMIEITTRHESKDTNQEYCHMVMATAPENDKSSFQLMEDSSAHGLVQFSTPCCDQKGELGDIFYSLDGHDYLVASYGSNNFYTYNLAEKVWMTLGLSQRCIGNEQQKIVYDDLDKPVLTVAQGHISSEYHWKQTRNVTWEMRNDYLRSYLWMRGHVGIRSFCYQYCIEDSPKIRALMQERTHLRETPESRWYDLDIREHINGLILVQVRATVIAILPEKCPPKNVRDLIWPGDTEPMSKAKTCRLREANYPYIYLKDEFLKKYENDDAYESIPFINPDGICYCSPSYKGQWSFCNLRRVGRNIIKVSVYDLYEKAIPNKEILHAYQHAISPVEASSFDPKEENIVEKTKRFIEEILQLGDLLHILALRLGIDPHSPEKYIGFSKKEIYSDGWENTIFCKIAKVASLNMSAVEFLSRCKTIHECLQQIKTGLLKGFLIKAGVEEKELKEPGSLKLLQGIQNISDFLVKNNEPVSSWRDSKNQFDWKQRNSSLSALFINNDLRQADSHEKNHKTIKALEIIGFDSAQNANGYGKALDFIFDEIIKSIQSINKNLSTLMEN